MSNTFAHTSKNRTIPKILALFVMASVILPNALLILPTPASAEELQAETAEFDDSINIVADTDVIQTASDIEPTVPTSNSAHGSSSRGRDNPPTTGSITVCKVIVDSNNHVATSSSGLPAGVFSVNLTKDANLLRTASFNTATFVPNTRLIGSVGNDAQCTTVSDLTLGQLYNWSEESITGAATSTWQIPRYNDQFTVNVGGLTDFFLFDVNNDNSDGIIGLTPERPNRTVVVLNRYSGTTITNTAPVITLVGANPMSVTVGQSFIDPGATAFDTEDGDITSRVVTTGTVDVNTVGSYLKTYSVTDTGGLTDIKTRTVNVVSAGSGGGGGGNSGGGGGGGGRHRNSSRDTAPDTAISESLQACPFLIDDLHRNRDNKTIEVLKLQYFLKYYENFTGLALNGVFDQATFNAVSTFQERYADDILKPWGHDSSTGFVYILTKKKINEIFCKTAFPITLSQEQEIKIFRELLINSKRTAISPSAIMPSVEIGSGLDSTATGTSRTISEPIKDISDIVGLAPPISAPNGQIKPNNLNAIASAIFSMPNSRAAFLQGLYFLLIAVIAVYLATEIVVGSMNTNKLSKHQVWARKISGYIIGLFIAIIVAILYKIFSIVIPLLILVIISGAFLAWAITKRTGNKIIHLPPTGKK